MMLEISEYSSATKLFPSSKVDESNPQDDFIMADIFYGKTVIMLSNKTLHLIVKK